MLGCWLSVPRIAPSSRMGGHRTSRVSGGPSGSGVFQQPVSWTSMKITVGVALTCLVGALILSDASADCVFRPGRVVKVRVLRCESARPYLEAAELAKPMGRFVGLAKTSEERWPGTVLIGQVSWELRLVPARSGTGIDGVTAEARWARVEENTRLWLKGVAAHVCSPKDPTEVLDLWVHPPCCDLVPPYAACLADMDYGEPMSKEIGAL